MFRIFKTVLSTAAAGLLLTAGAVGYYRSALPDSYYVTEGEALVLETAIPIEAQSSGAMAASLQTSPMSEQVALRLFGVIPVKTVQVTTADAPLLIPGGTPFGIKLLMDGVMVVGIADVGAECPAARAGIQVGDVLVSVNDVAISGNTSLRTAIAETDGDPCEVTLRRGGCEQTVSLEPVYSQTEGCYQAGLWVRDSTAGVGTVTYYEPGSGNFAGLGHPICDVDTGEMIPLSSGEVADVTIGSVVKGQVGAAGELRGYFTSSRSGGILTKNNACGIFGVMNEVRDAAGAIPMARKQEIRKGKAEILCTVSGTEPRCYEIEIEEIDLDSTGTKDMVIRVTDEALIAVTGGIVQGMSGSPILQGGKLVGAVTHVLVNDPTRGYGIFAERMYAAG